MPDPAPPHPAHRATPARGPSFARGLWRIAAADASGGNDVLLLRDGPRTYAAMLELIAGAEREVMLESYIFRDDAVGERVAGALLAAAARGVRVRVLADWFGAFGTARGYWRRLRAGGIAVQLFNRPGLRPWLGLLPRDHRKLLVVDGAVGITGGIGIGAEWLGEGPAWRRSRWRDTAVQIAGPAAADMARAFEGMWRRAEGRERRGSARTRLVRRASGAHVDPATARGAVVGIIEGEPRRQRIARALQLQAVSAERCMWIASAYFVPSQAEIEALAGAARDGVDVRLLLPSRSDHRWVHALTTRIYRTLLRNSIRIFEWQGQMMHAKTSVLDGRWVRVGSTDFNILGVSVNYELDALIEDAALGADAEAMFLEDLERSREVRG